MLRQTDPARYYAHACQFDREGNFAKAAKFYFKAANLGHAASQYNLGVAYERGDGVKRDSKQALDWFIRAANNKHPGACWHLSGVYGQGWLDQPCNLEEMRRWKKAAASIGHKEAQNSLGCDYLYGNGEEKDAKQALEWFNKSAQQKNPRSYFNMAIVYQEGGKGVSIDMKLAVENFTKSIGLGHIPSYAPLARIYQEGLLDDKKDVSRAIGLLKLGARGGDPVAQCNLGVNYEQGIGLDKDEAKAVEQYTLAANKNFVMAQTNLAVMFLAGRGVLKRDRKQALYWFTKAAEQGDSRAASYLGDIYLYGNGVTKDNVQAKYWLQQAAAGGDVYALSSIGVMHLTSENGFTKDTIRGIALLQQAALAPEQEFSPIAWNNLAMLYADGTYVPRDNTKAVEWFQRAANKGFASAQHDLALMLKDGLGIERDEKAAAEWTRKAAENRFVPSQLNLALMYAKGIGVPQDSTQAAHWYLQAAENGDIAAQVNLGAMYFRGKGIAQDSVAAIDWFSKAAAKGDTTALYNLAVVQYSLKNITDAIPNFTRAATQGHVLAQHLLGSLYLSGAQGLEPDPVQALLWLERAKAQGDVDSQILLIRCYLFGKNNIAKDLTKGKVYLAELLGFSRENILPVKAVAAATKIIAEQTASVTTSVDSATSLSDTSDDQKEQKQERSDSSDAVDELLVELSNLRQRILHMAESHNKRVIKKLLAKNAKLFEDLNTLDLRQAERTVTARINQLTRTFTELSEEVVAAEKATIAVKGTNLIKPVKASKKVALSAGPALSSNLPAKKIAYTPSDRSQLMRAKLDVMLMKLVEVDANCKTKIYSEAIQFYASLAVVGETFSTLVNFQDDAKYGHLYDMDKTWQARCNAFGDADLINRDLTDITVLSEQLHTYIASKEEDDKAETPTLALARLFKPVEKSKKAALIASLKHCLTAIVEINAKADTTDPMVLWALAGICMRYDKAAVELLGIDKEAYRIYCRHYRDLHKTLAPLGRTLRHFNFKYYDPDNLLRLVQDEYHSMQAKLPGSVPAFTLEHFPKLVPAPKVETILLGSAALAGTVGMSPAKRSIAAKMASVVTSSVSLSQS